MQAIDKNRGFSMSNENEVSEDDVIIKSSPCGRWEKRKKQYPLRDFPCYPSSFMAIDTEEGLEVVWVEVRVNPKSQYQFDTIRTLLDIVLRYDHPNLVKFMDYWIEEEENGKLIVLISELLTCGSISQFIKKSKLNGRLISMNIWVRWCKQILLGMSYLHNQAPPFILRSMSCDSIFIQHNGLIKIAMIHSLGVVESDNYVSSSELSNRCICSISTNFIDDIISFGHVALSLATHDCSSSASSFVKSFNPELCSTTNLPNRLQDVTLKNSIQGEFIKKCLHGLEDGRFPSIRSLLLHPILFEVPSLRLLSLRLMIDKKMHAIIENEEFQKFKTGEVAATAYNNQNMEEVGIFKDTDFSIMDLRSYFDEVKIGKHPITCIEGYDVNGDQKRYLKIKGYRRRICSSSTSSFSNEDKKKFIGDIMVGICYVYQQNLGNKLFSVTLKLKMKDNRVLKLDRNFDSSKDNSNSLAEELISENYFQRVDYPFLQQLIEVAMKISEPVICSKDGSSFLF